MPAREFLMACEETSFGVPKALPVLGTHKFYMRLHQQAAFDPEATPVHMPILYGGGVATQAEAVSDVVVTRARFGFLLFPGIFSAHLLKWAMVPINTGRTVPWTTTDAAGVMPVNDLASLSFYRGYLLDDGATYRRTRWAGMKCETWELSCSAEGTNRIWVLSGTAVGIRPVGNAWDASVDPDAVEFPAPAETEYPSGPFTFGHLASGTGTVTVGANRAATCLSVKLSGSNKLGIEHYTSRFPTLIRYCGRDVKLDLGLRLKVSPNDRDDFRALTKKSVTLKIDNGVSSLNFALQGANLISPWKEALPFEREYQQNLTLINQADAAASGNDLVLTTA